GGPALRRLGLHVTGAARQGLRSRPRRRQPLPVLGRVRPARSGGGSRGDPPPHLPRAAPARRHRDPHPGGRPRMDPRRAAPGPAYRRCAVLLPSLRAGPPALHLPLAARAALPPAAGTLDGRGGGGDRAPAEGRGRALRDGGGAGRGDGRRFVNILGLIAVDVGGHPSACMLKDGRLVAFAEEERFVRVKQALGYFPSNALRFCLEQAGLGLKDVDLIAFGWDATAYRWRFPLFLARSFVSHRVFGRRARAHIGAPGRPPLGSAILSGMRSLVSFQPRTLTESIVLGLRDAGFKDGPVPPIVFMRHHLAHAASAYYCSGFDESAILVFDGHGEENTTTIFRGEGRRIERLKEI